MTQEVVHRGEIDVDLTDEGGFEGDCLQLDDDVAAELQVVEEQVEVEVAARELEVDLSTDEREATAQLQEEALDVIDQGLLDLALSPHVRHAQEVEEVRVLEHLGRHVGISGRERFPEVRERLAPAVVRAAVDLEFEGAPAPTVAYALAHVPLAESGFLDPLQEADDVTPRQS